MRNRAIWSAFETSPGGVRAIVDWKEVLGLHFDSVKPYLKPTQGLATSVPCRAKPQCGCDHAVVEHKRDDLVSVCRCEPKRCDTAQIDRTDTVVAELNLTAVGGAIAEALGAKSDDHGIDGLLFTRQVGTYSPQVGVNIPLILTVQSCPADLQTVAERLLAKDDRPFVLLSPTERHWKPECDRLLRGRKAAFIPLSDAVTWNGSLSAKQSIADMVPDTLAAVLPPTKDRCVLRKDGATWTIVFQDLTKTVRHSIGMEYIARLIRNPGQNIIVSLLRAVVKQQDETIILGSAGTILDQKALNDYKERIDEIEEELETASGDRKATLLQDRETLLVEIGRATGLGGRMRHQSDDLDRARKSVSAAIYRALTKINAVHPSFHQHLDRALDLGFVLSYRPSEPLVWAAE